MRIDSNTTLSLALVVALVGGGIQYGRQSQRIEGMEHEMAAMRTRIEQLTEAISSLRIIVSRAADTRDQRVHP